MMNTRVESSATSPLNATSDWALKSTPPASDLLLQQVRAIGLARFVGRINAGVIRSDEGYEAVEAFLSEERKRPLLSRLTHLIVGRDDTFTDKKG